MSKLLFELKFAAIAHLLGAIAVTVYILFPAFSNSYDEYTATGFYLDYILKWFPIVFFNLISSAIVVVAVVRLQRWTRKNHALFQ